MEIFLQWTPIVDGVDIIKQPIDVFRSGEVPSMPILMVSINFVGYDPAVVKRSEIKMNYINLIHDY